MNVLMNKLVTIGRNFKKHPRKSLSDSYSIMVENQIWIFLSVLLSFIVGIGNIMYQKYLPISILRTLDSALERFKMPSLAEEFGRSHKVDGVRYFVVAVLLFWSILLITTFFSYMLRSNFFKKRDNFFVLLKINTIVFVPSVFMLFIASISICFSLALYVVFLFLSMILLCIYYYQHLLNLASISKDRACITSAVLIVLLAVIVIKFNINKEIADTVKEMTMGFSKSLGF